jgi:hypothetical protein
MSGYYDRLGYDKCAIEAQHARSVADGNYALYAGATVHPKFNSSKTVVYEKSMKTGKKFEQKNATIGTGYGDVGKRVALEDSLRGTDGRTLTKCSAGHFYPCTLGNGPGRKAGECNNVKAFNPTIHERDLFETNMNVEYSVGFGEKY